MSGNQGDKTDHRPSAENNVEYNIGGSPHTYRAAHHSLCVDEMHGMPAGLSGDYIKESYRETDASFRGN